MLAKPEIVDTTKQRLQVILFGNGLNYQKNNGWKAILNKLAEDDYDSEPFFDDGKMIIPNSIYASISSSDSDSEIYTKIKNAFSGYEYTNLSTIQRIVDLHADAYLTTNYTYDLEECLIKDYSKKNNQMRTNRRFISKQGTHEKYLLHTYNYIKERKIWHIHGEIQRPSSVVISLDNYVRQIGEMVKENKKIGNKYLKFSGAVKIQSWIDYFMVADIYIIGFGFDFSEFDLWWLVNRRRREKAKVGEVFFYEQPSDNKEKKAIFKALSDMGVNVILLPSRIEEKRDYDYHYTLSINDIEKRVKETRR